MFVNRLVISITHVPVGSLGVRESLTVRHCELGRQSAIYWLHKLASSNAKGHRLSFRKISSPGLDYQKDNIHPKSQNMQIFPIITKYMNIFVSDNYNGHRQLYN